jgi:hypothetical protein
MAAPFWPFSLELSSLPFLGTPLTMIYALLRGRLRTACVAQVLSLRIPIYYGCRRNGRISLYLNILS